MTILFITHQVPKGLRVDDAVILGTGGVADVGDARQDPDVLLRERASV